MTVHRHFFDSVVIALGATGPRKLQIGAGWKYFDIDANHSPNVTAPDALVRLFDNACIEARLATWPTSQGLKGAPALTSPNAAGLLPKQPVTFSTSIRSSAT
jgi:hypothetical protein